MSHRCLITATALAVHASGLHGQAQPAASYLERYREIVNLRPSGQVADVENLVLRREGAELNLERGAIYLLSPVGGRTVGAAFSGFGRFKLAPQLGLEQAEIARFAGRAAFDDTITQAVLLFADSTEQQLRALTWRSVQVPGDVGDRVNDLLGRLKGEEEGSFASGVLAPLLNGETSGFFLAHLQRAHGDAVLFEIDPRLSEAVKLSRPVSKARWGSRWATVTQFPALQPLPGTGDTWRFRHRLSVPRYQLEVTLTSTGSADLDFAAQAAFRVVAAESIGPWLNFGLHPKLVVDSARWGDGTAAHAFKAKDDDEVWVRASRRLDRGDSLALTLFYHGNLIDRYGNWFFIDPGADWWPANHQGRDLATFDVTYHSPSWYPLASIGQRIDSSVSGRVMTTRWVDTLPTPFATFNLGLFESYRVQEEGAPSLEVLISEDAHRLMRRELQSQGFFLPQQRKMPENVAADIANSLKWFTHAFGPPPYSHFYVTEIPYGLGVSFPGVIHLSWFTFQNTSLEGFDEYFRAHEAAHQWWGNAVRPGSYRDTWLAEGLATFSGLWYLQALRKRNTEYFKFLDQYEMNIRSTRNDVGPIWLGFRNATPAAPAGYHAMTYEKGAWVVHMLRIMMLDLQTRKEDRFMEMMRDYYASFRGRSATTDDFQRVVEHHGGVPMGWFFDQWVRGTSLPTYHVAWKNEPADGGRHRVRLRVTQKDVPADFQAFILVSADLGENRFANFRLGVDGTKTEYVSPLLPAPAKNVVFNELHSVLADVKMERW